MSTYVRQVDGDHYEFGSATNQHWDLMDRWDIEYLLACASAYVVRYDRKGTPVKDLDKAISYIDKQLACHPNKGARRTMPWEAMDGWCHDNTVSLGKRNVLRLIHCDGSTYALRDAIKYIKEIRDVCASQAIAAQ